MAINNKFTRKYSEWVTSWQDRNVHDMSSTYDFVSSESTLLVSGPPEYVVPASAGSAAGAEVSDDVLIPIGLVQSATIQQRKQVQQLNEVGSRQLFTIPGRSIATASVARILFDGPSLLFAMSSYYKDGDANTLMIPTVVKTTEGDPSNPYPTNLNSSATHPSMAEWGQTENTLGAYWGNLGSSIFNKPMGLGFIFLDTESDFYGGLYLEKCFIVSYNLGVSSQQTILLEQVQIAVTRVRPIRVGAAKS
jgi:hypothetical protein